MRNGLSREELRSMVAAADKDNSGFLDKQEFLGMVACQVKLKFKPLLFEVS